MSHMGWKRAEPWRDRFRTPRILDLLNTSSRSAAAIMRTVRDHALSDAGSTESVRWLGIPWRWTVSFTRRSADGPWLFLVANPETPRVAAVLPAEVAESLARSCGVKSVREGAANARVVGETAWVEWPIGNVSQARVVMQAIASVSAEAGVSA